MGIQGLWEELSPAGERVATETFQETRRPLRLAIDTSIWIFQVQNGTDQGSNPALRTFYYRLCRLLAANVQPVFVFDGPKKPPFKRNQRTGQFHGGVSIEDMLTKRLIKTFGFDYWDAPGEAEAECAVFQKLGKVDIVITEDVDCVMFGAMKVGRELPDTKTRTHMQLYKDVKRRTGLDKDGLVLVAMMSGGDYLPAGVPGCGPKIAAEIARAGFGSRLLQTSDYAAWREELAISLTLNTDNTYSKTQPALAARILTSQFPDPTILHYYTHPVTSPPDKILGFDGKWGKPDVRMVAELCKELFAWNSRNGMGRFMRSFTPAYLIWMMANEGEVFDDNVVEKSAVAAVDGAKNGGRGAKESKRREKGGKAENNKTLTDFFKPTKATVQTKSDVPPKPVNPPPQSTPPSSPSSIAANAVPTPGKSLILDIHSSRTHFSTDSTPELRLSYIPSTIVPYLPLNFNLSRANLPHESISPTLSPSKPSPSKAIPLSPSKRAASSKSSESDSEDETGEQREYRESKWSPDEVARIWIPEVYVRTAMPLRVTGFEERVEARKSPKKAKSTGKTVGKGGMSVGAMEQFVMKRTTATMTTTTRVALIGGRKAVVDDVRMTSVRKENMRSSPSSVRKTDLAPTQIYTSPISSPLTSPIQQQQQQSRVLSPPKFEFPLSISIPTLTPSRKPIKSPSHPQTSSISPSKSTHPSNSTLLNPPSVYTTPTSTPRKWTFDKDNKWDNLLGSSDSDSEDSLPSPSDLIAFLTPRKERIAKKLEESNLESPSKGSPSQGRGKMVEVKEERKSSKKNFARRGRKSGKGPMSGFREFGGTLHEVDRDGE